MVRNEADRWLPSALDAWAQFADEIVALNDGSTDDTAQLLYDAGAQVHTTLDTGTYAWGAEVASRQFLFEQAVASGCDYLFWLDADMVPLDDPRPLLFGDIDGVYFNLYDLWSLQPLRYRSDRFWQGHRHLRLWLIRNPGPNRTYHWNERGIHCGHLPLNLDISRSVGAPMSHGLLHYAYATPEMREKKLQQYIAQQEQLTESELLHALSITDTEPTLEHLTYEPRWPLRLK